MMQIEWSAELLRSDRALLVKKVAHSQGIHLQECEVSLDEISKHLASCAVFDQEVEAFERHLSAFGSAKLSVELGWVSLHDPRIRARGLAELS
jgi:hypothetical protein